VIQNDELLLEIFTAHVDLLKEVLRKLLARAIPKVTLNILCAAKPAPLRAALVARDVVTSSILFNGR